MMINVLIDTNVLIYGLDKSSLYHQPAAAILTLPDLDLFVTTKNISEFFAVTSKLKLPVKVCQEFYKDLKINTTILFPTEESLTIFEQLTRHYHPIGNQVYDMEIVSIMLANEVTQVATFNHKDFKGIKEIQIYPITS